MRREGMGGWQKRNMNEKCGEMNGDSLKVNGNHVKMNEKSGKVNENRAGRNYAAER